MWASGSVLLIVLAAAATFGAASADPARDSGERALVAPIDAGVAQATSPAPGYYDTSEYFIGRVGVAVVLVESVGDTYDWTDDEVVQTLNGVDEGLAWWVAQEPKARLSFSYALAVRQPTTYEPIEHPLVEDWRWIGEIMTGLGYADPDVGSQVRRFNNDVRAQLGTDWAFSLFVADSDDGVSQGRFADGQYAHAYYGGPWVTMARYSSWAFNAEDYFRVVPAHETGHIFYATDEYDSRPVEFS
ncbi:MAG: hypothetical protein ACT4OI_06070, partial [Methanobacteriota archaeon]